MAPLLHTRARACTSARPPPLANAVFSRVASRVQTEKRMVRLLVTLALLLAGCSPTVTRTIVMERATAESLGGRARIVSGGPAPTDPVKARVVFHEDEKV